jgi:sugar phosphate permease
VVAGIFQAMCLNLPARLAMDWFPAEERDLATTAASMANVLGQMVFSLLAPLLVHTPEQLDRIMFVQWVPAVLVAAGCWVFLKAKPKVAPSAAAAIQWRETAAIASRARKNSGGDVIRAAFDTIWKDVSLLLSNANFMLLAAGFSAGTGMVWAVLILEGQLITPCGFSDAFSGTAGAALLATGIVSAFIIGGVMEATKAYLELQRGVMIAAFVATVGVLAATRPAYPAMLLLAYCLLGAALQPLMPVTLEHAVSLSLPAFTLRVCLQLMPCLPVVGPRRRR